MKVLITGSTGMLGTSLSRHFLMQGHDVCGLSRGKVSRDPFQKEHRFQVDITDKKEINRMIRSIRPEAIIHTAAITDVDHCEKFPEEAYQINSEGTRVIAESAHRCEAFFCYISSDYVFDGGSLNPYREEDRCNPLNVYGKSKWLGEEYTRTACRHYFIIRTSWLFGENRDSFVHHVLEWTKTKKEIRLVEDKWGTPTYTPDLAGSIYLLFEKNAASGIYHITNGGSCSWLEYGQKILYYSGINDVSLLPMRLEELNRLARRPHRSILSHDKFYRVSKRAPRPWEEALEEYLTTVHPVLHKK